MKGSMSDFKTDSLRIVQQGVGVRYYHILPGPLSSILAAPERRAVLQYIAFISPSQFPEFVADILVHAECHTLVDITEGPGDEKQDILTLTPTGERQLTQCKHTSDLTKKTTGDDLDLLFSACFRKNCSHALYVTNVDLTPQAKRYVNDNEYSRGFTDSQHAPCLKYWNGSMIWNRVSQNSTILNKWFSGMSQAHGLRRFTFHLLTELLPTGTTDLVRASDIAEKLNSQPSDFDNSYTVTLRDDFDCSFKDSFRSDLDLGVPYIGPRRMQGMVNIPLRTTQITVTVADEVGRYNPALYRDLIVKVIGEQALPATEPSQWWHLIATKPTAFAFFHDVQEPKVVDISKAETYVRIGTGSVVTEQDWVRPQGPDYRKATDEQGENTDALSWTHIPSDTEVLLLFEQQVHPLETLEREVFQKLALPKMAQHCFFAVEDASGTALDHVRRAIDGEWLLLQSDRNTLFFGVPQDVPDNRTESCLRTLMRAGIKVLKVEDEDRKQLVDAIEQSLPVEGKMLVSLEHEVSTPIWLDKRIIWLQRKFGIALPADRTSWITLIKFKAEYEAQYGFNFMLGEDSMILQGAEIRKYLCDLQSIRGLRMLDLSIGEEELVLILRIKVQSYNSTMELLSEYIKEIDQLVLEITTLCNSAGS